MYMLNQSLMMLAPLLVQPLLHYHRVTGDSKVRPYADSLYLGQQYHYELNDIVDTSDKYGAEVSEATDQTVVDLITNKILLLFSKVDLNLVLEP